LVELFFFTFEMPKAESCLTPSASNVLVGVPAVVTSCSAQTSADELPPGWSKIRRSVPDVFFAAVHVFG
jgi:hypothetical protein